MLLVLLPSSSTLDDAKVFNLKAGGNTNSSASRTILLHAFSFRFSSILSSSFVLSLSLILLLFSSSSLSSSVDAVADADADDDVNNERRFFSSAKAKHEQQLLPILIISPLFLVVGYVIVVNISFYAQKARHKSAESNSSRECRYKKVKKKKVDCFFLLFDGKSTLITLSHLQTNYRN